MVMEGKKKKKIVIFGNGNHCKIVKQEILENQDFEIYAIYDFKGGKIKKSLKYKKNKINLNTKFYAITAVGDNRERFKLVNIVNRKFKKKIWISVISKNSIVNKNVKIGKGSLIVSGSVVNTGAFIGNHSIINTCSIIDHDTKIGNFTTISPGSVLAGKILIRNFVFVGIGSVIREKIIINSNIIIGANSFVNKNCINKGLYFGSPAKYVKSKIFNIF